MVRRILCLLILLQAIGIQCFSQTAAAEPAAVDPVPGSFSSISLGMELSRVKELLEDDPNFDFRGDPDVSLLLRPNESLIECRGFSYIRRAYFQFYERKLYTMTLVMNELLIDHYTLYTRFTAKYGEPDSLSPSGAVWESENLIFSLERPLIVKYIDKETFDLLKRRGSMEDADHDLSRDKFLELF